MENKVLNKMKSDTNIDVTKQEVKIVVSGKDNLMAFLIKSTLGKTEKITDSKPRDLRV